ncbi:MAG: (2Fe-2S)-binding protein [Aigarchaeota archaeon]|nr:(2Fe-2S)-binding protein [Aigarchaeota archaeon]MDW8092869.1 (2Fe-2S)-binding protein [Nitrososphaerota archaeon]
MARRKSVRKTKAGSNALNEIPITVRVNGVEYKNTVQPRLLLIHYLRDVLGLTGSHIGCDTSNCGACTVLMKDVWGGEWRAVKSCTFYAFQANGKEILTIEGLARDGELHPLQKAFWEHHGLQCGYCTPGMIMAALGLLLMNPNPTVEEIRKGISGNLCRCTGYINIIKAIDAAAKEMSAKGVKV